MQTYKFYLKFACMADSILRGYIRRDCIFGIAMQNILTG